MHRRETQSLLQIRISWHRRGEDRGFEISLRNIEMNIISLIVPNIVFLQNFICQLDSNLNLQIYWLPMIN